jgi:hypothetical protein
VGAELGAVEVEGANELVGAELGALDFLLPFPPLPTFPFPALPVSSLASKTRPRWRLLPLPPLPPFPFPPDAVGTDEGRSEGWSVGAADAVGAGEMMGVELGALEVGGANELLPFPPLLVFPPLAFPPSAFPPLPPLPPFVGTAEGMLEG